MANIGFSLFIVWQYPYVNPFYPAKLFSLLILVSMQAPFAAQYAAMLRAWSQRGSLPLEKIHFTGMIHA
jgi:hypothetical protein